MSQTKRFTNAAGVPVADNTNIMTVGRRGPALLQDIWLIEKLAHFDREVIPERRMHAKGWGAHGTFTVTHDITRLTCRSLPNRAEQSRFSGAAVRTQRRRKPHSCVVRNSYVGMIHPLSGNSGNNEMTIVDYESFGRSHFPRPVRFRSAARR
jgi:hypothetical protein